MSFSAPGPDEDPQSRIEREEFARGHVPEGTPPVEPRAAATVVVARPGSGSFELLLLERSSELRFAAGAYVFPGGIVDPDDGAAFWEGRIPPTREPAACVGAIRELFEETGLLPESRRPSDELARERQALLRDERLFSDIARQAELDFSGVPMAYFSRWITPRTLARRYDTRFFLLALDDAPSELVLTGEHESARWEPASRALERFSAGALPMLFPTRKTLERLAEFHSLEAALETLREVPVEPLLAKLDVRDDGIRPLMPGDPGYDDVY